MLNAAAIVLAVFTGRVSAVFACHQSVPATTGALWVSGSLVPSRPRVLPVISLPADPRPWQRPITTLVAACRGAALVAALCAPVRQHQR